VYHYPGDLNVSVALPDGRRILLVGETLRFLRGSDREGLCDVCPAISAQESDLLIGAEKVGGAAQARRGNAILYHTTVLVEPADMPMERLLLAMRPGHAARGIASRPRRTTSLREAGGNRVTVALAAEAVAAALGEALGERPRVGSLDEEEERQAAWLARAKYGDEKRNLSLPPTAA